MQKIKESLNFQIQHNRTNSILKEKGRHNCTYLNILAMLCEVT